jgi:hypothetical protein
VSWLKQQGAHFEPASGAIATIINMWPHLHTVVLRDRWTI